MDYLKGSIDCHVHAGPDIFARRGDAIEIASRAEAAGMRALVFKAHNEATTTRAQLASRVVPGIELYGGIALNQYLGGLNPVAVESALVSGAKIVWMPSIHAANHIVEFGGTTYGIDAMSVSGYAAEVGKGIRVIDSDGAIRPEVRDIAALAKTYGAALATSHLDLDEIRALVRVCSHLQLPIIVTHALYVPRMTVEDVVGLAAHGCYIELCAASAFPMAWHDGHGVPLALLKEVFDAVPATQILLSSDAGQPFSPWPHEILELFMRSLAAVGVAEDALHEASAETPARLLQLDQITETHAATTNGRSGDS